jgi:WD40 repeat protein
MSVCPGKRFVAVAEASDRALVNVFDLKTLKKRKVLSTPECASKEYTSLAFSNDNQLLLTMGSGPDYTLVCWNWAKAKAMASHKITGAEGFSVTQVSFSLMDFAVVCVSGNKTFMFLRIVDGVFKPIPLPPIEEQNFTAHCWLKQQDDLVVLATDEGDMYLFRSGDLLARLNASPGSGHSICSLAAVGKGFVAGGSEGSLWVFEASDDPSADFADLFTCFKTFKIDDPRASITNLAVSTPHEDSLAVSLNNNQIYLIPLANMDVLKNDDIEVLSVAFHAPAVEDVGGPSAGNAAGSGGPGGSMPGTPGGSNLGAAHVHASVGGGLQNTKVWGGATITGLDVCCRKPIVATCGLDRTVRVWDYMEKGCDLCKRFPEEAFSVSLHPSGLHILVGFADKLRLMNVLMDDIRPIKEFPVKACRECQFSNGGQYFAAVNGNTIVLYNTYTCETIGTLRGHNSKVRSVFWVEGDRAMISAGIDGAVYQWDLEENKREGEFVLKGVNYSSALSNHEGTSVFAAGSDRFLKEIEFPASQVSKELECGVVIGQLVLSHSQKMLFAGTSEPGKPGCVRSYKYPLTGDFTEYQCLSAPISRLRISFDDQYVFAAGEDGALCIFEVRDKEGRPPRLRDGGSGVRDNTQVYAEEILVTKSDLEEKNSLMTELKNKVEELQLHNEYQLRLKDMNYTERIKEVTEKFTQELEQDKNKFELLREEKNDMEMEYEERIKQMEEKHQHELQELEASYQQKIMTEVERYQEQVRERDLQRDRWEDQQKLLVSTHERYVSEVTDDFEQRLDEDKQLRIQMEEEKLELQKEFNETKRQLEQDIDQEIFELKEKYDAKLAAEREATLRFKGENGIMKKKFSALQKDIEDQREEIKALLEKEKELYEQIKSLEKEIQAHKREIRSRDETIGEKEKRIYDLKKKNQELEKFKFVLDYKIKELKRQIEPRENEITDMKEQIKDMDRELEQFHKSNAQLDLMIGELRKKLDAMQKEILTQRQGLADQESLIRRFRCELHECVQFIQEPAVLKEGIQQLFKKHVQEKVQRGAVDGDIEREYRRQKEYLEQSVTSLKQKFSNDVELHKQVFNLVFDLETT